MKKIAVVILLLTVITGLCACSSAEPESDKLTVITTIFPPYDFARQICGDKAEVLQLLPLGGESHSYEPTAKDIIAISNCDLFIYNGGESDAWVEEILNSLDTPIKTLKMTDTVTALKEEYVDGMQTEEHDHDHNHDSHDVGYDEHIWTSPENAVKIAVAICNEIAGIDTENSKYYTDNTEALVNELYRLDSDFTDFFGTVENKLLIFGDRFPFRYFADRYSLRYFAAFPGCSDETEPSAATAAFLIEKIKSEKVGCIYYIEFSNHAVADTLAEDTGIETAMLHSCHNITKAEFDSGCTYISLMRQNLETLEKTMK